MIFDWAVCFKFLSKMAEYDISWGTMFNLIGMIFIALSLAASQFAVAHEVMHKHDRFYRILGTLHMSKLFYMHFTYHHLYGHHKDVATPVDPSTALKGETVYEFIPRCIKGSWMGVYKE